MTGGSVVTVGSFDGVHLGHQALLAALRAEAEQRDGRSVLVTFEPHPASVLAPQRAPRRLTPAAERAEIVAELGLDRMLVLRFDPALAALSAGQFVREVLLERCGMRALVIGANHRVGRGGDGDSSALVELGRRLGFAVRVIPPVPDAEGAPISSTGIRVALDQGELRAAARWLGRPYRISGRVVPGAGRGRTIGIPTLNLEGPPDEKALPPDGVYAGWVEWGGGTAAAMLNQGPRPTVGDARRSLEAHLFDWDGDLYGRTVRVEWVERLRDIRRFGSLEALRAQLEQDRERALAVLGRPTHDLNGAPPRGAR